MTVLAGVRGVLFDLLMAVMDSPAVWTAAARSREHGMRWRDAVTARMRAADRYVAYEVLVADAAAELGVAQDAVAELWNGWAEMEPWPDAHAIRELRLPYAFVTNCSAALADVAARRSGLQPRFVLAAEEATRYKPDAAIYIEACRRLGSAAADTLFVAGAAYDAEGASRAGLQAALVERRTDQSVPDGVWRISSLRELAAVKSTP